MNLEKIERISITVYLVALAFMVGVLFTVDIAQRESTKNADTKDKKTVATFTISNMRDTLYRNRIDGTEEMEL